jgi:predicted DNA-binding transcriptional regulator AlpA
MSTDRITEYDQIPLYLDLNELARTLGIPKSSAYKLLNSKGFPMTIIAGKKMVKKEKLLEWLLAKENHRKPVKPKHPSERR